MRTTLILGVSLVLLGGASAIADPLPSTYGMEEMYQLAQKYRDLTEKRRRSTGAAAAMKAGEFKTHVAAILDGDDGTDRYNDCGKRVGLNDIAYRAAVMITSFPLDRSQNATASLAIALVIGCSEPSEKPSRPKRRRL